STRLPLIVDRDFCPRGMRSDDGSPPIFSFYTPPLIANDSSHRQSSFHAINTVHPGLAKPAQPPAPLLTRRPPPLDPFRRLLRRLLLPRRPRAEPAHLRVLAHLPARPSKSRPTASCNTSAHAPVA
ncbi:unnamed protein product, partial [Ectocarpus sp. 12 AP-2014]